MMKKTNIIMMLLIVILIFVSILFLFPTQAQAQYKEIKLAKGIINPGNFEPEKPTNSDIKPVVGKANIIIGAIKTIGVAVTMIALMVMGIKYMTGSVEEKAEYKKTMIPYLVGVFIFFGLSQLIAIIIEVAEEFNVICK